MNYLKQKTPRLPDETAADHRDRCQWDKLARQKKKSKRILIGRIGRDGKYVREEK